MTPRGHAADCPTGCASHLWATGEHAKGCPHRRDHTEPSEAEALRQQLEGAVDENRRLRLALADVIEGEQADEGTPQWYALRNARALLFGDRSVTVTCPTCHGDTEVPVNPSRNHDPQCEVPERCPDCGDGTVTLPGWVVEALRACRCVTPAWCSPEHPCSRCGLLAVLERAA